MKCKIGAIREQMKSQFTVFGNKLLVFLQIFVQNKHVLRSLLTPFLLAAGLELGTLVVWRRVGETGEINIAAFLSQTALTYWLPLFSRIYAERSRRR